MEKLLNLSNFVSMMIVHHERKVSLPLTTTKSTTTRLDDDEDNNYTDSEIWLSIQQSKFSRRSKKLSQRKKLLKSQANAKAQVDAKSNVITDDAATSNSCPLDMTSSSQEDQNSQSSR